MTILATQPFKLVYFLTAISFELARLPIFLGKYLFRSGRQHPEWTFLQALGVRVFSSVVWHLAKTQHPTTLSLAPGAEKERFVRIKPESEDMYQGPLRSVEYVQPEEIGGTWFPAALSAGCDTRDVKVILHIHGGAFIVGDGRTRGAGSVPTKLLKHTPATHVFSPQYRLSSLPASKTSNPFPAALQDGLTAYLYLLNDLNIPPSNIIFSGDSAGGNAAIVLLRYIAEYGADLNLPNPSAALLWSPWIDPSDTTASYVYDNKHYATDYLSAPFTYWGTNAYAGLAGPGILSSPYVTQKNKPFKTKVPLFVNVGGVEILYFDIVDWVKQMQKTGNDVVLDVTDNVPHDILPTDVILGFGKEGTQMAKTAGEWLRDKIVS